MMKNCVRILLCIVLSGCISHVSVYAAGAEVPSVSMPSEGQENGVLVVECRNGSGVIEISYGDITDDFSCDYYELEIPMEIEVIITIQPYPAYEVEDVKLGDTILEPQDGCYKIIMSEPFAALCITYEALSGGSTDSGDSSGEESSDNKVHHSDGNPESENSVSSVSYDVTVTYLEPENDDVTEITSASDADDDIEAGTVDVYIEAVSIAADEGVNDEAEDSIAVHDTYEDASKEMELEMPAIISESIKGTDIDVKTGKDDVIMKSTDGDEARPGKILENGKEEFDNSPNTEEKSVLILSSFPLYLVLVWCMILVKRVNWMKKVEIDG